MKKLLEEKLKAYKEQVDYIIKNQKYLIEKGENGVAKSDFNQFLKIDISVAEESAECYFEEIQELLKEM